MSDDDRFPAEAATHDEALRYYRNRATQLLWGDWTLRGLPETFPWGIHVSMMRHGAVFHSVYVLKDHVHQGHLRRWIQEHPGARFVVMDECAEVSRYLARRGLPHTVATRFPGAEYREIERYYANRRAKGSGQWFMAHIDEGLYVLKRLGASERAMKAFCLHPLVQTDDELTANLATGFATRVDPEALALAIEYRHIANAYLSKSIPRKPRDIALSPLHEVSDMLRADKIQNRRDFERFHLRTHPKRDRLVAYFREWFQRLDIDEGFFASVCGEIAERVGEV